MTTNPLPEETSLMEKFQPGEQIAAHVPGLTVVHAGPARAWGTQLCLGLRHRIPGYGRLLAEMPG